MSHNSNLQERKQRVIARGMGNLAPIYIEKGKNAELWDADGQRYIDFGSGIAVNNTGHSHPQIIAAVKRQLDQFSHSCIMVTPYRSAVELAEKLTQIAPGDSDKKAIFVTTGAEAVENCIKIARAHTKRRAIIAFNGGFHGRTHMTMGLTGKITPYKHLFGPFPNDIYHVPYPISYHGISAKECLQAIENLFKVCIAAEDVAAIIIEPIQGEGGFYAAPAYFLLALREICDTHGIVLIADEIQTGFARTGTMFCFEQHKIEPDLITMAKGIAGGFPLAAVVGKAEIMDAPLPGGLGGTYAGSPLACVAALEVLKIIEDQQLMSRAKQIGERFQHKLNEIQKQTDCIGEIRIHGAMIAIELVHNNQANRPDAQRCKDIVTQAHKKGLILLSCGTRSNVIRFLPPLTISDAHIDEGLTLLQEIMKDTVNQ